MPRGAVSWCGPVVRSHGAVPWYGLMVRSRCGRARYTPAGLPTRAAAIHVRGGSPPQCAAWHPAIFARRITRVARYTPAVALTAAPYRHYASATGRAHDHGAFRTTTGRCGAMGTSRPTAITPTIFARNICTRIARGGSPLSRPCGGRHRPYSAKKKKTEARLPSFLFSA